MASQLGSSRTRVQESTSVAHEGRVEGIASSASLAVDDGAAETRLVDLALLGAVLALRAAVGHCRRREMVVSKMRRGEEGDRGEDALAVPS